MIDYLLYDPLGSQDSVLAQLPAPYLTPAPAALNQSLAAWTSIVTADAVCDAQGMLVTPKLVMPGIVVWIQLPKRDPALEALAICTLVTDRDAYAAGQPVSAWQLYVKTGTQLVGVKLDPILAGTSYPFSGG